MKHVTFPLNYFEDDVLTIHFDVPVTEWQAVNAVQEFLNVPLDGEYLTEYFKAPSDAVKQNELLGDIHMIVRGDLLYGLHYLESIKNDTLMGCISVGKLSSCMG